MKIQKTQEDSEVLKTRDIHYQNQKNHQKEDHRIIHDTWLKD